MGVRYRLAMGGHTIFTLILIFNTGSYEAVLNKCSLTIVRCCDTRNQADTSLRCFELNGCPEKYWHGIDVCSESSVAKAFSELNYEDEGSENEKMNQQKEGIFIPWYYYSLDGARKAYNLMKRNPQNFVT